MGQQQLLIILLTVIIVGVAIALAITYFKSHQQEVEIDEVINEMNHIDARAQEWYRKPTEFGGGSGSFAEFTLQSISQPDSTDLAKFKIISRYPASLGIQAVGKSNFTVDVVVYPDSIGSYQVTK
jgi:Tfp pilus assembly protein PilE